MTRLLVAAAAIGGLWTIPPAAPGPVTTPSPSADSIASPAGPGSAEPNLAVGLDGRVYMSWLEPMDSGYAFKFSSFDGTSWARARTIRSGRDFFVNWADFPSIVILGKDHLAAHWLQRTGKSTYAYGVRVAQSRDGGATWSMPVRPHIDSADVEHGFVALWRDHHARGAARPEAR